MKKVDASELLDLGAYEGIRDHFRSRIVALKQHRRLAVGEHMTLIWENHDTVLLQIQEMLRTERITRKSAIAHELDTYNALVPADGQLSATLMIEYNDPAERATALVHFASLRQQMQIQIGSRRVTGVFHDQPGEEADRLPAVNYVTFDVGDAAAAMRDASTDVAVHVDHPHYQAKAQLPAEMRRQLADDLSD